jgi:hypothetical protein
MRLLETHLSGWSVLLLLTALGGLFYAALLLAISRPWRGRLLSLSRRLRKGRI